MTCKDLDSGRHSQMIAVKGLAEDHGNKLTVAGDPKPIHRVVALGDLTALSDAELDALEASTDARLAATDVQDRE
jgi:hypothetical protein